MSMSTGGYPSETQRRVQEAFGNQAAVAEARRIAALEQAVCLLRDRTNLDTSTVVSIAVEFENYIACGSAPRGPAR